MGPESTLQEDPKQSYNRAIFRSTTAVLLKAAFRFREEYSTWKRGHVLQALGENQKEI
jgi:hypothetical protein